jgi:class 3 adenylate cyclase
MDVGDFLRELGLEQYDAAFRENDVDAELLPDLTEDDLKGLGVASIGHRRRLLKAIAGLRLEEMPTVDSVRTASATRADELTSPETTAERRPISVMFCDLVGSTALSARLDPEDLREVIRTYQTSVRNIIQQFDGFIARYVGDGVLIYFGWPEARETDAERALRAGLAVAAAVCKLSARGESLEVRVGIATGLVVIGEPIGSGDSRQQTAVGETPNLAARLQGLAGPGQVVIDAATRRQVGGLFDCRELGTIELKGLAEPVPAWHELVAARDLLQEHTDPDHTPGDPEADYLHAMKLTGAGRALLYLGYIDQARSRIGNALSQSRQTGNAPILAMTLTHATALDFTTGSPLLQAEELLALTTEHKLPYWLGLAMAFRGLALATEGKAQEAYALLTQAVAQRHAIGTLQGLPGLLARLANVTAMLGRPVEAWNYLADAAQLVEATDERLYETYVLHQVPGDLLRDGGDQLGAEQHYRQAIATAERQSAKLFQLRASASLARLWHEQGKPAEAYDLLAPIYGWFAEGLDTPILKEAKAQLDELA